MVHQTDQERAYGVHRLLGCRARPSQQRFKRRVGAARDGLAIREDSTQRRQRTTRFCRNFYLRRFEVSSSSLSNRASGGRATMAINFKGAHCPPDIILMGIRWYVAYPLSPRHVEELREERGVEVDHSTIHRPPPSVR